MSDNQVRLAAEEAQIFTRPPRVLCIDDEVFNLDILEKHLRKAGYDVTCADSGRKGLSLLEKSPDAFDVVLLDRMMPVMDGMEVLRRIKASEKLRHLPVILQTAMGNNEDIVQGIEAGAYYYVVKPYEADMVLSIVAAARRGHQEQRSLGAKVKHRDAIVALMKSSRFDFKTLKDAREVAAFLSNFSYHPSRAIVSLTALMVNAVEHGNLEIGRERKGELLLNGKWEAEIERRLALPEYRDRRVVVMFERRGHQMWVRIRDEGKGFNWKEYMDFDPSRITDPNGRGIAMANITSPGCITFVAAGNEVVYTMSSQAGEEKEV